MKLSDRKLRLKYQNYLQMAKQQKSQEKLGLVFVI